MAAGNPCRGTLTGRWTDQRAGAGKAESAERGESAG